MTDEVKAAQIQAAKDLAISVFDKYPPKTTPMEDARGVAVGLFIWIYSQIKKTTEA